jgi:hypothetical protein
MLDNTAIKPTRRGVLFMVLLISRLPRVLVKICLITGSSEITLNGISAWDVEASEVDAIRSRVGSWTAFAIFDTI